MFMYLYSGLKDRVKNISNGITLISKDKRKDSVTICPLYKCLFKSHARDKTLPPYARTKEYYLSKRCIRLSIGIRKLVTAITTFGRGR